MMRPCRLLPIALGMLLSLTAAISRGDEPKGSAAPPKSKPAAAKPAVKPAAKPQKVTREELEKQFAERLSGSTFVGHFSMAGKEANPPQMERYTLTKVSKVEGDMWQFDARVQYGQLDVTVPMRLEVKWADDTPVISLTDLTIPGLGTFTSRVLVYGDRYAGTWQHGEAGGHLWGRIEKAPAKPKS